MIDSFILLTNQISKYIIPFLLVGIPFYGLVFKKIKVYESFVDGAKDGFDIAFALFPTPIESLINVADANKVMPPKSTWFEPKLLDGLLSHKIND